MATALRQGHIVWVEMPDPAGRNPKVRPGVVVTPTPDIVAGGSVVVVAVSTRADQASAEQSVELPWQTNGHPRTRLRMRCVAVCTWRVAVPVDDLPAPQGFVPDQYLAEILAKLL